MKKKFNKLSKIKKILLGILLLTVLLTGIGISYGISLVWEASKEIPNLEKKLDRYLIYQSNKEYKQAYETYSSEYKDNEDLDTYIKQSSQLVPAVADYKNNSLQLDNFFVNYYIGQPITLRYEGNFFYEDNDRGQVSAIFILKDKKWELLNVNITAPPSRLDKYNLPQEKTE